MRGLGVRIRFTNCYTLGWDTRRFAIQQDGSSDIYSLVSKSKTPRPAEFERLLYMRGHAVNDSYLDKVVKF